MLIGLEGQLGLHARHPQQDPLAGLRVEAQPIVNEEPTPRGIALELLQRRTIRPSTSDLEPSQKKIPQFRARAFLPRSPVYAP
jgi:hypothetical protein